MRNLISIIVLIITFTSSAQLTDYFGNGPRWGSRGYQQGALSGGSSISRVFDYYIADTINYNGVDYFQINRAGTASFYEGSSGTYSYSTFDESINQFVRQEGRKIMRYNTDLNQEELFIDYTLNVGDTVHAYQLYIDNRKVTDVDSILVGSEYRRVLSLELENGSSDVDRIIEGIGVVSDAIHKGDMFESNIDAPDVNASMYCYWKGSSLLWNNQYTGCYAEIDEAINSNFSIYPNPATNQITISHNYQGNLEYEILDLSGRRIFYSVSKKIDISNLTSGVYLVALKLDGKVNGVEKFIKD